MWINRYNNSIHWALYQIANICVIVMVIQCNVNMVDPHFCNKCSQIVKFMGPTWGPPGSCRPQMGPMLPHFALLWGFTSGGQLCGWDNTVNVAKISGCNQSTEMWETVCNHSSQIRCPLWCASNCTSIRHPVVMATYEWQHWRTRIAQWFPQIEFIM